MDWSSNKMDVSLDPPPDDFSKSVFDALPKKPVPKLFQLAKQAVIELFLQPLSSHLLISQLVPVLEYCSTYLEENLCSGILKRLLDGENLRARTIDVRVNDLEDAVACQFLGLVPFGNRHLQDLDLTFWNDLAPNSFDVTIVKKLLSSCYNLTTLIMPYGVEDDIVVHLSTACRKIRYLELKGSYVSDLGVCALAGYEIHEEEPIFRRVRPALPELRYLGLKNVLARDTHLSAEALSYRRTRYNEITVGVSVTAAALVLEALPSLLVFKYGKLLEALLLCKRTTALQSLPLDTLRLDNMRIVRMQPRTHLLNGFLPNLARIDVVCMAEKEVLPCLPQMRHLKELRLTTSSRYLSSESLHHMTTLGTQLQTLAISCQCLKSSDLQFLRAGLPNVRALSISYRKFRSDVNFLPGPGWENLVELKIDDKGRSFSWSVPKFCTENSRTITTLFLQSIFDRTSKEEELESFLSEDKFRKLNCLFLNLSRVPASSVCRPIALCPYLEKFFNCGVTGPVLKSVRDHIKKNNVELELLPTSFDPGNPFPKFGAVRRVF